MKNKLEIKQMKKTFNILAVLFTACLLLTVFSCDNPFNLQETSNPAEAGYGRVNIQLTGNEGRTIIPSAVFTDYVYTFTKDGGEPEVLEPVSGSFTLETGDWNVRVDAYLGEDLAASGEKDFTLADGDALNLQIALAAEEAEGEGTFKFNIQYPSGTSVQLFTLESLSDSAVIDLTEGNTAGSTAMSGEETNVPAGFYLLTVLLQNNDLFAGTNEAVHIYKFAASEFGKTGSPIAFTMEDFSPLSVCTVIFNTNGGDAIDSQEVANGGSIMIVTPERTGFAFDGWYTKNNFAEDSKWDFDADTVTGPMILYAKWLAIYEVQFITYMELSGIEVETQYVVHGNKVAHVYPAMQGSSIIDKWYTALIGGVYTNLWDFDNDIVTSDLILHGEWIIIPDDVHLVRFYVTNSIGEYGYSVGVGQILVDHGEKIELPEAPTLLGYTSNDNWYYYHWNSASEYVKEDWDFNTDTVNANLDLRNKPTPHTYTIHYDANGGEGTVSDSYHTYDTITELSEMEFTRTGYTGDVDWNTKADGTGDRVNIWSQNHTAEDGAVITLYAKWMPIEYKVIYTGGLAGGEMISTHKYDVEVPLNANIFTLHGYDFIGWADPESNTYTDKQLVVNLVSTPNSNIILSAQWEPWKLTVTFDSDGGTSVSPQIVNYYEWATEPEDPVKTGYVFLGWYLEGYEYEYNFETARILADTTLKAKWGREKFTLSGAITVNGSPVEMKGTPPMSNLSFGGFYFFPDQETTTHSDSHSSFCTECLGMAFVGLDDGEWSVQIEATGTSRTLYAYDLSGKYIGEVIVNDTSISDITFDVPGRVYLSGTIGNVTVNGSPYALDSTNLLINWEGNPNYDSGGIGLTLGRDGNNWEMLIDPFDANTDVTFTVQIFYNLTPYEEYITTRTIKNADISGINLGNVDFEVTEEDDFSLSLSGTVTVSVGSGITADYIGIMITLDSEGFIPCGWGGIIGTMWFAEVEDANAVNETVYIWVIVGNEDATKVYGKVVKTQAIQEAGIDGISLGTVSITTADDITSLFTGE